MGYKIINLKDIYDAIGEKETKKLLKTFKCELNQDVEYFIKHTAIEFSKQDFAKTFLVFASYQDNYVIVGYFSITNKSISIKKDNLSKTKRKYFSKYSTYNPFNNSYEMVLPLIGQLGKNYYNNFDSLISGDVLLKFACDKIIEAQSILGGRFVYLECEDAEKLKDFYESNGFVEFGKRNIERDEKFKDKYLLQMLCDLSKKKANQNEEKLVKKKLVLF